MSKDDEKTKAEAEKAIGRAAAGALTTQVLAGYVPPTVAALVTAASGVLLPEIFRSTIARGQRRLDYFLAEFRAFYGRPPEQPFDPVEAEVDPEVEVLDALNAPETRDATLDALRAALDAVDDAAVPYIARLMYDYTSRAAKPDWFYRGALRMLAQCDANDIGPIRAFVLAAFKVLGDSNKPALLSMPDHTGGGATVRRGGSQEIPAGVNVAHLTGTVDGYRVMYLFTSTGLGRDFSAWDASTAEVPADIILRLARILAPAGDA